MAVFPPSFGPRTCSDTEGFLCFRDTWPETEIAHRPFTLRAERWDGSLADLVVATQPVTLNLGGQLNFKK
jgi:hypothetical protein